MKDWNLGSKSGQWKIRRFLSELHFEYDVPALFSLVVAKDDKDNRDILQVHYFILFIYNIFIGIYTSPPWVTSC